MNGLVILATPIALIVIVLLPKLWQRGLVAGLLVLLGVGALRVCESEMKKAMWSQERLRILEPTKRVLTELRDLSRVGNAPEANALASYMVDNWHRVGTAPWMETGSQVRAGFPNREKRTGSEQAGGANSGSAGAPPE